jgi:hypothetical protein
MNRPKIYQPGKGQFQMYRFTTGDKKQEARVIAALSLEDAIAMWRYQMKGNAIAKNPEPKNVEHLGPVTVVQLPEEDAVKAA